MLIVLQVSLDAFYFARQLDGLAFYKSEFIRNGDSISCHIIPCFLLHILEICRCLIMERFAPIREATVSLRVSVVIYL